MMNKMPLMTMRVLYRRPVRVSARVGKAETITIAGKALKCRVRSVQAAGDFPEYGRGVSATVYQNESLPGGMARVWLKSNKGNQPFEFRGTVVVYGTR